MSHVVECTLAWDDGDIYSEHMILLHDDCDALGDAFALSLAHLAPSAYARVLARACFTIAYRDEFDAETEIEVLTNVIAQVGARVEVKEDEES